MYFDRFDIAQAYYLFFMDYHEGQTSEKYKRLCQIGEYLTCSPMFEGYKSLSENGKAIYQSLEEKEKEGNPDFRQKYS
jgi:hypothetical protein